MVELQIIVVLTVAIVAGRFLAYNLQSIHSKRCDGTLKCFTALCWSDLKVFFKDSGDHNSVKTSPIVTTVCVCLLLSNHEVHTKF